MNSKPKIKYRGEIVGNVQSLCKDWNCTTEFETGLNKCLKMKISKTTSKGIFSFTTNDKFLKTNYINSIRVAKSNRLKTCAGKACYSIHTIILHAALFDTDDYLFKIDRHNTFFHEICHFIAYALFNEDGHGYWWKQCMINFGLKPKATYNPMHYDYRGHNRRDQIRFENEIKAAFNDLEI